MTTNNEYTLYASRAAPPRRDCGALLYVGMVAGGVSGADHVDVELG